MMNQDFSRRSTLRAGAALAGTVVLGSLAGCEQAEQSAGDDADADATEATETEGDTGEPAGPYRAWLPEPEAFEGTEHYFFRYIDYDQFRANESNFDSDVYDRNSRETFFDETLGLSADDVDGALFLSPVGGRGPAVVTGSFSASDIADYLTDNGSEEEGEIGGYTVYTVLNQGMVGVSDGTLVMSDDGTVDQIRTLIETKNGKVTRYHDASDDMATVLDRFGTGTFVGGTTSDPIPDEDANPAALQFAGQVGFAFADSVDGATVTTEIAVLFETGEDVDMAAISEYTGSDAFLGYDDLSSTQEGRVVIIAGTGPTEELYAN